MIRITIDLCIVAKQDDFLFHIMKPKFDHIIFWREIETQIESGGISKLSLFSLKDGSMYLSEDTLLFSVYRLTRDDLLADEDAAILLF